MRLVLDAGALLAIERRDRILLARLKVAAQHEIPLLTSSGAVAQVWRGGARQAPLAKELKGIDEQGFDGSVSRRVGELLGAAGTVDVVDAHVASLSRDGDVLLTSDDDGLAHLLAVRGIRVELVHV